MLVGFTPMCLDFVFSAFTVFVSTQNCEREVNQTFFLIFNYFSKTRKAENAQSEHVLNENPLYHLFVMIALLI